jgi:hypothetical protein
MLKVSMIVYENYLQEKNEQKNILMVYVEILQ